MALKDEVKARFSTQYLANLTNPQDPAPTAINESRLDKSVADVQAMFEIYAGAAYDNADARHVPTAVAAVQEMLRTYTGQISAHDARERAIVWIRDLGRVTGRNRILPRTTSTLQPSAEQVAGIGPSRPEFDNRNFDFIRPETPGGGEPYTSP